MCATRYQHIQSCSAAAGRCTRHRCLCSSTKPERRAPQPPRRRASFFDMPDEPPSNFLCFPLCHGAAVRGVTAPSAGPFLSSPPWRSFPHPTYYSTQRGVLLLSLCLPPLSLSLWYRSCHYTTPQRLYVCRTTNPPGPLRGSLQYPSLSTPALPPPAGGRGGRGCRRAPRARAPAERLCTARDVFLPPPSLFRVCRVSGQCALQHPPPLPLHNRPALLCATLMAPVGWRACIIISAHTCPLETPTRDRPPLILHPLPFSSLHIHPHPPPSPPSDTAQPRPPKHQRRHNRLPRAGRAAPRRPARRARTQARACARRLPRTSAHAWRR